MMVAQRSSAAKWIGIICIVLGAFGLTGLSQVQAPTGVTLSDLTGEPPSTALMGIRALSALLPSAGFILGGVWMKNYEKRGVHLIWASLGLSILLGMASMSMGDDGGLGDLVGDGASFALAGATSLICNGICGLIVAIPLMSANGGLE